MTSWFCIALTCFHVFLLFHDQHDDTILDWQKLRMRYPLCSSRKYPSSPHGRDWKFLGRGGFSKAKKFNIWNIWSLTGIPSVGKLWITFGTTHSSQPADQFHTKMSGHFKFTLYRCKISNRSEILAPNNRGELMPVWLVPAWHFVVVPWKQNTEPWEGIRVDLHWHECRPGVHVNTPHMPLFQYN